MAEELAEERRLQAHLVGQVVFAVGTAGIAVASGVWVAKSDVGTALVRNSIVKYQESHAAQKFASLLAAPRAAARNSTAAAAVIKFTTAPAPATAARPLKGPQAKVRFMPQRAPRNIRPPPTTPPASRSGAPTVKTSGDGDTAGRDVIRRAGAEKGGGSPESPADESTSRAGDRQAATPGAAQAARQGGGGSARGVGMPEGTMPAAADSSADATSAVLPADVQSGPAPAGSAPGGWGGAAAQDSNSKSVASANASAASSLPRDRDTEAMPPPPAESREQPHALGDKSAKQQLPLQYEDIFFFEDLQPSVRMESERRLESERNSLLETTARLEREQQELISRQNSDGGTKESRDAAAAVELELEKLRTLTAQLEGEKAALEEKQQKEARRLNLAFQQELARQRLDLQVRNRVKMSMKTGED